MRRNDTLYRMIVTAAMLAVGYLLPFLTGQMQTIGKLISPLHIPVLICGLTCGWGWGGALGVLLPLTRMAFFKMPAAPMAYPMAFELCAYGVLTGLLYPVMTRLLKGRRLPALYIAMVIAMVCGRIVGGIAKALLLAGGVISSSTPFTFAAFFASYFVDTAVGAVIHLIVVPAVVIALEKARLSPMSTRLNA